MRRIHLIAWLLPVTLLPVLLLAGCSRPDAPGSDAATPAVAEADKQALQAEVQQLQAEVQQQRARVAELESRVRVRPLPAPVTLIDANYPPAVAGAPGWEYHKSLSADLDGDGQNERVSITNNAFWDPVRKEFGWDDGHPWHVYIQEADGTRTYVFSGWVQMGRLDAILAQESPGFYLLNTRAGSLSVHRITYRGPARAEVIPLLDIPLSDFATFAGP